MIKKKKKKNTDTHQGCYQINKKSNNPEYHWEAI